MPEYTDVEIPEHIVRDPVLFSAYVRDMQKGAEIAESYIRPYRPMPYQGDTSRITLDIVLRTAESTKDNIQIKSITPDSIVNETDKRSYPRK